MLLIAYGRPKGQKANCFVCISFPPGFLPLAYGPVLYSLHSTRPLSIVCLINYSGLSGPTCALSAQLPLSPEFRRRAIQMNYTKQKIRYREQLPAKSSLAGQQRVPKRKKRAGKWGLLHSRPSLSVWIPCCVRFSPKRSDTRVQNSSPGSWPP